MILQLYIGPVFIGASVAYSLGGTIDRYGILWRRVRIEIEGPYTAEGRQRLQKFREDFAFEDRSRTCELLRTPDEPLTHLRIMVRKVFLRKGGTYVFTGYIFEVPKPA